MLSVGTRCSEPGPSLLEPPQNTPRYLPRPVIVPQRAEHETLDLHRCAGMCPPAFEANLCVDE